jgi:hypothetical protein
VPRDAYFALADEAKRQGIEFGGHVPIEVRAGEASASRTGPDAPSGFRNQALSSHRLTKRQLVQTMLVARDLRGWDLNQQPEIVGVCLRVGDRPDYSHVWSPSGEQPVVALPGRGVPCRVPCHRPNRSTASVRGVAELFDLRGDRASVLRTRIRSSRCSEPMAHCEVAISVSKCGKARPTGLEPVTLGLEGEIHMTQHTSAQSFTRGAMPRCHAHCQHRPPLSGSTRTQLRLTSPIAAKGLIRG